MAGRVFWGVVFVFLCGSVYGANFNDGYTHIIGASGFDSMFQVDNNGDRQPGTHVIFAEGAGSWDFLEVSVYNHGKVTLDGGGEANMPGNLHAYGSSEVTINTGNLHVMQFFGSSRAHIYGGTIREVERHDSSEFTIYGRDFTLDGQPIGYGPVVFTKRYMTYFYYGTLRGDLPGNSAFEMQGRSYPVPESGIVLAPGKRCPSADLNGDCKLNFLDLAILVSEWLQCGFDDTSLCD